ncbi:hypothetical protein BK674_21490 [Pseudomonas moraviensis]|uniref:Uncharacterized protein n=1 Tax=Pseudomonas moraviensis TaxID=321662 RepID=A0A423NJT6_9PSED|nr:hypothetical protein BK674_21490 [Pseudomonas moraviensis]
MDDLFNNQELPPHPNPLPQGGEGEREPIFMLFKSEVDSISQVGVSRISNPVSPLSLRERVRVRGFSAGQKKPRNIAGFLYQAG